MQPVNLFQGRIGDRERKHGDREEEMKEGQKEEEKKKGKENTSHRTISHIFNFISEEKLDTCLQETHSNDNNIIT